MIYHLWWCIYVQAMYTGQPPNGMTTCKHRPIDVPFFPPFGSCQRSTSNSMRWNRALLSVSHWCITRPRRSRLCKHTLSKPIEDVGCWPHGWFTVYLQGKRGSCDGREQLCSRNEFRVANEEGQAIKSGRARCQAYYLTLSEMINELK